MKYVPIGKIISTHGIKGEAKFRYYNVEKEVLYSYTSFFIHDSTEWKKLKPTGINQHKGLFLLSFEGLNSPEKISFLINKELFVKEEDLRVPDKNEYYEYQLTGMSVLNRDGRILGKVYNIIHTGANDILIVKGEKELLVPMFEDFIEEINIEKAFIKLTGLISELPDSFD